VPRVSQRHRDARRQQIVDAARRCFTRNGFQATSMQDIFAESGLSAGAVYGYFASKDDLVAAIVEEELPRWASAVERALNGPPDLVGKVEAFIRAQLEVMTDGRHAAAVALVEHALTEPALERIRDGHAQLLRPLVTALTECGVPEPGLRAGLIQGIVDAAAKAAQRRAADTETIVRTALAQAVHGLPHATG
jgi:AcrR family transcriptional regulator